MNWIQADGRPQRPDWSRSDQAEEQADLEEADYCSQQLEHLSNHKVVIGGIEIEIPVVTIDCEEQEVFSDVAVMASIHPKLRRLIKSSLQTHHLPGI